MDNSFRLFELRGILREHATHETPTFSSTCPSVIVSLVRRKHKVLRPGLVGMRGSPHDYGMQNLERSSCIVVVETPHPDSLSPERAAVAQNGFDDTFLGYSICVGKVTVHVSRVHHG